MTVEQFAVFCVGFLFLLITTYGWSYWYGHSEGRKAGATVGWNDRDHNMEELLSNHSGHVSTLEDEIEFLRSMVTRAMIINPVEELEEVDEDD